MRRFLAPLVLGLGLLFRNPAAACSQGDTLNDDQIDGTPLMDTVVFDDRRYGVQFRLFDSDHRRNLSYILFDGGFDPVNDQVGEQLEQMAMGELEMVADMNGVNLFTAVSLDDDLAGDMAISNTMYLGTVNGLMLVEFLGVGQDGECLHKIRYTEIVASHGAVGSARRQYWRILRTFEDTLVAPMN